MKTILLAAAIAVTATTGAFAQSSALDVFTPEVSQPGIDFSATAGIGNGMSEELGPRLGDGSPVFTSEARGIDFRATASIGGASEELGPRLGDGSPVYN
ncbi:hypothetical protein [Oceaniradius stylonematis]|uniref:hypothetical protein n=1 Tax=Oceaniradius stylonematis TaxID=2184161 RepID=UPI003C7A0123